MKERPILFSAPMVRAIIDGKKTQTRRALKVQPPASYEFDRMEFDGSAAIFKSQNIGGIHMMARCPYGSVGDRLWVRETWMETCDHDTLKPDGKFLYRATHEGREPIKVDGDGFQEWTKKGRAASPWKPSLHMPRWASRITLEIVSVRVERLQDISGEDCIAEGIIEPKCYESKRLLDESLCRKFRVLWESINGPGSWDANPWAWVIEFRSNVL